MFITKLIDIIARQQFWNPISSSRCTRETPSCALVSLVNYVVNHRSLILNLKKNRLAIHNY